MKKVTPHDVYAAIYKELETTGTIKCIAELDNGWYNVTFNNGNDCEDIAVNGITLHNTFVQCERANIQNSAVIYIKAPFEMTDQVVISALTMYGTVENIRRQFHQFDSNIETGVRSCLIKNLKKPIPSYIKVGGFSLPVRYRGQQKTCKICAATSHMARECPRRGRCFVCGSLNHKASWHDREQDDTKTDSEDQETPIIRIPPVKVWSDPKYNEETNQKDTDSDDNGNEESKEKQENHNREDNSEETKNNDHQRNKTGFWDEALRAGAIKSMKRKSPEESKGASPSTKMSRDERYEEESDMEQEDIQNAEEEDEPALLITTERKQGDHRRSEQNNARENTTETKQDPQPSIPKPKGRKDTGRKSENHDEDPTDDGEDTDQEGFTLYTRHGVQRTRKKRTSWQRKPTDTQLDPQPSTSQQEKSSQPSQSSQNTQRARGRGKPTGKV